MKRFGEKISRLINRGNEAYPMTAKSHLLPHTMIVKFNVLCARMKQRVRSHVFGAQIITE